MILFKMMWVIDALVTVVFLYFFFIGISDGSVSGTNIGLWIVILLILAAVLWGSIWLRNHKYPLLALILAMIVSIPTILFILYFGVAIANHERWN
jgi:hypothetical protein